MAEFDPNYLLQALLAKGQFNQQTADRDALMKRFREQLQLEQDKADAIKKEIDARSKLFDIQAQQGGFNLGQAQETAHAAGKVAEQAGESGPIAEHYRTKLLQRDPNSMLGVAASSPEGPGPGMLSLQGVGGALNPAQQMQGLLGYRTQNIQRELGLGEQNLGWAGAQMENQFRNRHLDQQAHALQFNSMMTVAQEYGFGPALLSYIGHAKTPAQMFDLIAQDPRIPDEAKQAMTSGMLDRMVQQSQFQVSAWLEYQKLQLDNATKYKLASSQFLSAQNDRIKNIHDALGNISDQYTKAKKEGATHIMRWLAEYTAILTQAAANEIKAANYTGGQYNVPSWGQPGIWGMNPAPPFYETGGGPNPMNLADMLNKNMSIEDINKQLDMPTFAGQPGYPGAGDPTPPGQTTPVLPPTPAPKPGMFQNAATELNVYKALKRMSKDDPELLPLYHLVRDGGRSIEGQEQLYRIARLPKGEKRTKLIQMATAAPGR